MLIMSQSVDVVLEGAFSPTANSPLRGCLPSSYSSQKAIVSAVGNIYSMLQLYFRELVILCGGVSCFLLSIRNHNYQAGLQTNIHAQHRLERYKVLIALSRSFTLILRTPEGTLRSLIRICFFLNRENIEKVPAQDLIVFITAQNCTST